MEKLDFKNAKLVDLDELAGNNAVKTKPQVMLKVLLRERNALLEKICVNEINESLFQRKVVLNAGSDELQQNLVKVKNALRDFNEMLEILNNKIKDLTGWELDENKEFIIEHETEKDN